MSKCHSKIIIAEDEVASRKLLTRQLERADYQVVACADGRAALEAICDAGTGIVVADWMMPEMDGLDLCREVRRLNSLGTLSFVYYILLTAHSDKDQIVTGLEAGADDYLTKPYHKEELLARLRAGERIFRLQSELLERQKELRHANDEMRVLNQELEKLANTDMLTGMNNRRHLFERFAESWALTYRYQRSLACVMFDIDKFKSINDTHGHAAGDYVLKQLANVCRELMRQYDLIGRIGGEEFCVICPETDSRGAVALAERLRRGIEEQAFVFEGTHIPVTVSLGVAVRGPEHNGPDTLIAEADAMLYHSKQNGRNQTSIRRPDGQAEQVSPPLTLST